MSLLPEEGTLLRIFISEDARHKKKLLYEAIVLKAQENGLAGATVFRGIMGYQAGHEIQTSSLLRLSDNLPVVIEIVDEHSKIENFIPVVKEMVTDGLITAEKARIIKAVKKA
jgi:PII-like signaling protein